MSHRIATSAVGCFIGLVLFHTVSALFDANFTDKLQVARMKEITGLKKSQIQDLYGKPSKVGACQPDSWITGYAKPKIQACDSYWVYPLRFGLCYVFFDAEGVAFSVQGVGG